MSKEAQIKEIMQEDKLIQSFRPLLTCLQLQDLTTINEVTLYSFKKLFKLFHSCFNKTKLYNKLIEYLNNFKDSMKRDSRPLRSSNFFLINSIFILFTKMINNDEIQSIMKIGLDIEASLQNFSIHNFSLKPVLQRVINQQSSSKVINLLKTNITKDEYLNFLLETLKMEESHPFRERVSREDLSLYLTQNYHQETGEGMQPLSQDRIIRWTKIIRVLSKKIPRWLVHNKSIVHFFIER